MTETFGLSLQRKIQQSLGFIALQLEFLGVYSMPRSFYYFIKACLFRFSVFGKSVKIGARTRCVSVSLQGNNYLHDDVFVAYASVGRYSYISRNCYICRARIGSFTSIGPDVLIGIGSHPVSRVSTHPAFYSIQRQCGTTFTHDQLYDEAKLSCIGNDVWIGARCVIMDGVSIGDGAIVGAGSIVTRDVEPFTVVAGVPAKLLRSRFSSDVSRQISELAWWNWSEQTLRQFYGKFANPQEFLDYFSGQQF